jgi:hypothetical protein
MDKKIQNRRMYYKEKVIRMNEKLILGIGDARSRICNCEEKIESAYFASQGINLPPETENMWTEYWTELNKGKDDCIYDKNGIMISTPVCVTVRSKRNKAMIKYLSFFYEEFRRVLDPNFVN